MSADVAEDAAATYHFSALFRALVVMWRTAGAALLFVVANMVVQAVLTYIDIQSGFTLSFLVVFLISAASAVALYAVLASCALRAVDGDSGSVIGRAKQNIGSFTLWVAAQWALVLVASLVHPALVLLVAALTPFLPIAAMDGHRNALAVNFRTLGGKFGRWLVTTVILLVAGVVLFLLTAVNTFFVKGTPASVFFWLAIGVVAWWLLTAWALVYRDYRGHRPTDDGDGPTT